MLHRQRQSFVREVEHIKYDGLSAAVFTVVDGANHFDDGFAFVHGLLLAVEADDGEIALHQYAVVHHWMMMPA